MNSTQRAVIITGASQGTGPGLVTGYRELGFHVVATSRSIARWNDEQAKDIVEAVFYLESAPFVTGEVIHVDGGAAAGQA